MQVWDGLSNARIAFASPYAEESAFASTSSSPYPSIVPMATLVENLNLQRGLIRYLSEDKKGKGSVEIVDGTKVAGVTEGTGGWPVVHLESKDGAIPRSLRARLLVCPAVIQGGLRNLS